jgi:P-type Cu2+ transporter
VLAPIGFVLPMSIGAILMSASTVVVALNAQLLRRLDLTPEASTGRTLERSPAPQQPSQLAHAESRRQGR